MGSLDLNGRDGRSREWIWSCDFERCGIKMGHWSIYSGY
jgi:hypothetical protein